MMSYLTSTLLASLMVCSPATIPAPEKPVTVKGTMRPDVSKAGHYTVRVQFEIKEGWHTYGEIGDGSGIATSLKMKLPEGVKSAGAWKHPVGSERNEHDSELYVGKGTFSRSVVIEPAAGGKTIDVVVSYQACTDTFCNRPQTKTVSIAVPTSSSAGANIFERPVRINVNGKPLNTVAKKRFLSPGIFDVDGDGKAELMIGTLMGSVGVYENQNTTGKGDPVWGPWKDFEDAKGNSIRTSNW